MASPVSSSSSSASFESSSPPVLKIVGIGTAYPATNVTEEHLKQCVERHHTPSPVLDRLLHINTLTGIKTRQSVLSGVDDPVISQPSPANIKQINDVFEERGIPLAVSAAKKALAEWGGDPSTITHLVAVTCTHSSNPGFDFCLMKELKLEWNVERYLLHGVACAGGLAALRTAAGLSRGYEKKSAKILVVACEVITTMIRGDLEEISRSQSVNIAAALFGDGASAVVLSAGHDENEKAIYEFQGYTTETLEQSEDDLRVDMSPTGWRATIAPRIPKVTSGIVQHVFYSLVQEMGLKLDAEDVEWALHPGGLAVIKGVEKELGLTRHHLRASYDVYMNHGNTSSATIFSVLDKLRHMGEMRENICAVAFGPGVLVEMVMLRNALAASANSNEQASY